MNFASIHVKITFCLRPCNTLEEAIAIAIEQMGELFTPSLGLSSVGDGPWKATIYTPEITKDEVRSELREKKRYEDKVNGNTYEIRQLIL